MTNATNYREVTADFPDFVSQDITFNLLSTIAISGAEIIPANSYTMTLDAGGLGTINLPTPDNTGDLSWLWEVTLPDGRDPQFTLGAGDSVTLADLLAASSTSLDYDAVQALLTNKVSKTGDTMTGALRIANLTTTERDALTPAEGMIIYNTTDDVGQIYANGSWGNIADTGNFVEKTGDTMSGNLSMGGNQFRNYAENTTVANVTTSTYTIDCSLASVFILTLKTNTTIAFENATNKSVTVFFIQDTTGNRVVTWPAGMYWAGGSAATLSTDGGKIDKLVFDFPYWTDGMSAVSYPCGQLVGLAYA